jgi:glycosyltransferase involved in cell wall biosynthesis
MACGTPVVASAVGGLCDQIIDGMTGYLAPMGNAHVHAQAVVRLLDDDALRASCAAGAARRGAEFSLSRQTDSFLSWYQEILADKA